MNPSGGSPSTASFGPPSQTASPEGAAEEAGPRAIQENGGDMVEQVEQEKQPAENITERKNIEKDPDIPPPAKGQPLIR